MKLCGFRPTPSELAAQNIIDTRTAALFFDASPKEEEEAEAGKSGLATGNIARDVGNVAQRPSIGETVARGILPFRTDTKLNYDLQAARKQRHRARIAAAGEADARAAQDRPTWRRRASSSPTRAPSARCGTPRSAEWAWRRGSRAACR